jgi:integrase
MGTAAFATAMKARIPRTAHKARSSREGLSRTDLEKLFEIIDPDCPTNPWTSRFARVRNHVLILWALLLGPRRGELLSARVTDIDFRENTFTVVRRPDALLDPRKRQPLVKTAGRVALVSDPLIELTKNYIFTVRRQVSGARRHPFLFVDVRSGRPLSHSGFTKVFAVLRQHLGDIPTLTAHVLRHTWNDHFSALMEKHSIPEADEVKFRSYLQGWRESSQTAATYTKRYVRERARAASLSLQEEMARSGIRGASTSSKS